jgi:SAM-dependent methyltransferase
MVRRPGLVSAAPLSAEDLRQFCAPVIREPSHLAATMIGEAAFGLTRVAPLLHDTAVQGLQRPHDPQRLLEVGAGSLILSAYLACRGFDVTAVEPMNRGFEIFGELQRAMLQRAEREGARLTVLQCPIEELDTRAAYDLAFSINALEHMSDPFLALDLMYRAVRSGGAVFTHCPNYDVPFDSHFGIALIGHGKKLNELIYRRRIPPNDSCWNGLTFVRLSAVRRHCEKNGYRVSFNQAMLRDAFLRLGNDPTFAARMPRAVTAIGRVLTHARVATMLVHVPVRFQTPMEFELRKA